MWFLYKEEDYKKNDRLLTYKYAFFDFGILDLSQNELVYGKLIERLSPAKPVACETGTLK